MNKSDMTRSLANLIPRDPFILGLILTICLAYLFPGASTSPYFPLKTITDFGISFIFFFYGLKLSPSDMKAGLKNWRLHVAVQSATFILFPAIVVFLKPFAVDEGARLLWMALLFLAALPSTVSSSVVMVSIAKGNIPSAIFNASISGLIGIFVTPLWVGLFTASASGNVSFTETVAQLMLRILLPVAVGLFLHRFWGGWARKQKKGLALFDKAIILAIVFHSFGTSFSNQLFRGFGVETVLWLFIAVSALFAVTYGLLLASAKLLGFSKKDSVTLLFCGSKKSLVHGTVFSKVLFAQTANAGIFLVPIMIYHALQLIIISFIAHRYARE